MYLARTPAIARALYGSRLWRVPVEDADRSIYLTFDDGPIPDVTPWVLDQLRAHNAKATFFCIGKNIEANPGIFERLKTEGHSIGNHTWDHCNGRHTSLPDYMASVQRCQPLTGSSVFRPPYGRLTRDQARVLGNDFTIVMWSVLSGDFDVRIDAERCTRNVLKHTEAGSIVVFHDSVKAWPRLRDTLPKVLEHLAGSGYTFKGL